MKIAIVDDDELWIQKIMFEVKSILKNENPDIDVFNEGPEFIEKNCRYDVTLMDVEMESLDGFETTREYKRRFPGAVVAMITTDRERYSQGFIVNAYRYINKERMYEEMKEMFSSLQKKGRLGKVIDVDCVDHHKIVLNMNDIMYVETLKRKILIHTLKRTYTVSDTMKQMCEKLEGEGFYQCHQSYLVNLDEIDKIDGLDITMKNGDNVMVSKRHRNELEKVYFDRLLLGANR
jgi:DNA-binding LytR/AlgR family response regulator